MEKKRARLVMSALSQETRLDVYTKLLSAGPEGMSAGDVADAVRSSPTAMSGHLAILTAAKLVTSKKLGRSKIYRAVPGTASDLAAFLQALLPNR